MHAVIEEILSATGSGVAEYSASAAVVKRVCESKFDDHKCDCGC